MLTVKWASWSGLRKGGRNGLVEAEKRPVVHPSLGERGAMRVMTWDHVPRGMPLMHPHQGHPFELSPHLSWTPPLQGLSQFLDGRMDGLTIR